MEQKFEIVHKDDHILMKRDIRPIVNWLEFMDRWEKAQTYEELLGLLHKGFTINDSSCYSDRLVFYFNVADGWSDGKGLRTKPGEFKGFYQILDKNGETTPKDKQYLRLDLANKAFEMLCTNFFKFSENLKIHLRLCSAGARLSWWREKIINSCLFLTILNFFFTIDEDGAIVVSSNLKKVNDSYNGKFILEFIIAFTTILFEWEKRDFSCLKGESDSYMRQVEEYVSVTNDRVNLAKPLMIQILCSLNEINFLKKLVPKFDQSCIDKLTEIALKSKLNPLNHFVKKERKVRTIDEACYVGSTAAWLVKEFLLYKRISTNGKE